MDSVSGAGGAKQAKAITDLRRETAARNQGYRERALRILPHVCASCAREFTGKRLRELTVHHKDHNHDNNPPDGSNWELLCLYCHDYEHEKGLSSSLSATSGSTTDRAPSGTFQPFGDLDAILGPAGAGGEADPDGKKKDIRE